MPKNIFFKKDPLKLVGRNIKSDINAPDFKAVDKEFKEVSLLDFDKQIKVVTSFPSLDTPVCDLQVKEFNKRAANLSKEVIILGISKDLPFAQKRFCDANNIKQLTLLSDYRYSSFGINYGLLIKEWNLLARAVLVIDKSNIIRYFQLVQELSSQPDYNEALENLENILNSKAASPQAEELPAHCKPCEGEIAALPREKVNQLLAKFSGWDLIEDKKLRKEFKFKDFLEAKYFLDLLSIIAQEQGHHPSFNLVYNKLIVTLTTHAAAGLTENDFIMLKIINEVFAQ